jgi:hypothetical protein
VNYTASGEWLSNVFLALAKFAGLKQDGCILNKSFGIDQFGYNEKTPNRTRQHLQNNKAHP